VGEMTWILYTLIFLWTAYMLVPDTAVYSAGIYCIRKALQSPDCDFDKANRAVIDLNSVLVEALSLPCTDERIKKIEKLLTDVEHLRRICLVGMGIR